MKLSPEFDYLRPHKTELTRVGPRGDCGYVLPQHVVSTTQSLYSIGISTNWDFEIEMSKLNPGLTIEAFDRTSGWLVFAYAAMRDLIKGDPSVVQRQNLRCRLKSANRYFSLSINSRMFFSGHRHFHRKWVRGVKHSRDEVSFQESLAGIHRKHPTMLKIDIEGGEYQFIDDLLMHLSENHRFINCIIMELHDTYVMRNEFRRLVVGVSEFFPIVHIHGNNCAGIAGDGLPEVLEITFASASADRGSSEFPLLELDFPNDSNRPDLEFSFDGWSGSDS
jgi:hypothetical protein